MWTSRSQTKKVRSRPGVLPMLRGGARRDHGAGDGGVRGVDEGARLGLVLDHEHDDRRLTLRLVAATVGIAGSLFGDVQGVGMSVPPVRATLREPCHEAPCPA